MSPADAVALGALRREIEAVDAMIIDALAQRMALAREIRVVKQRRGSQCWTPRGRRRWWGARRRRRARWGCPRMRSGRCTGR
jgi:chorismate mutase